MLILATPAPPPLAMMKPLPVATSCFVMAIDIMISSTDDETTMLMDRAMSFRYATCRCTSKLLI